MFSAGDEFMDMTQSHTVNIANQTMDKSSSQKAHQQDTQSLPKASVSGLVQGFKDLIAGLSKTKSKKQEHVMRVEIISFVKVFYILNPTQLFVKL